MKGIRNVVCGIVLILITGDILAQDVEISKDDYIIYSVKAKKVVKPRAIIKDFKNYDVLFYGEEHNDSITHRMQTLMLQQIYKKYGKKTVLSMEMFDRDVQHILDEYLSGKIKESYFNKDSRQWKNYADYKPMVEFAKDNGLDVIAANAPFRYVNIASHKGLQGLMELSERAKEAIAPLPYDIASGAYAEKLMALMSHTPAPKNEDTSSTGLHSPVPSKPSYNIVQGQSLWDATMAYSIYRYKKSHPDARILHLNGRFHTEEYFGIVQRLNDYDPGIKTLVITGEASAKGYPDIEFIKYSHLGDYIIFTNPKLGKSY